MIGAHTSQLPQAVERFTVPYRLEGGSRHDRVLNELLEHDAVTQGAGYDRPAGAFDSAEDYKDLFDTIVSAEQDRAVLVHEFYLYDPDVDWRDETALELDIARFDPKKRTVHCVEMTGKNLECVRSNNGAYLTDEQKKNQVFQAAWEKGTAQLNQLQQHMDRFGWNVTGQVATFYQHGKRGKTEVELYPYTPEEDR